ncbi:hypothetical protein ACSHWG_01050 [Leucobacter sp. Z1108]|uniref:hypothetical protein n=1 Tax=Leucobacter sp. Z1108 TaxID=3439066 RepID=UPI003F2E58EB
MNNPKPPMLGPIIAVLGALSTIILMLVLAALQIAAVIDIALPWWIVMILVLPAFVFLGALISAVQSKSRRRKLIEQADKLLEERRAQIRAERETRIMNSKYRSGI